MKNNNYETTRRFEINNAKIGHGVSMRNFSGVATDYNNAGNRTFCVFLTEEQAAEFEAEGLNVKYLKETEYRDRTPFLSMVLKYRDKNGRELRYTPQVRVLVDGVSRPYSEEQVGDLDSLIIKEVDISFHGAKRPGADNYTNYVDRLGVVVETDWYDDKYGY